MLVKELCKVEVGRKLLPALVPPNAMVSVVTPVDANAYVPTAPAVVTTLAATACANRCPDTCPNTVDVSSSAWACVRLVNPAGVNVLAL